MMMDGEAEGRQIVLELAVQCKNLGKDANPVCGLFAIDSTTGQLVFLAHTEVMRSAPAPKFAKYLICNYYPGRNQKLQLNIYSASWVEGQVDNSIHEEDRIGSVIIAMDKVVPVNTLTTKEFSPISVELPLWHDTSAQANDRLQALGSVMKISFKASENQPEGGLSAVGPRGESNIHQSLAIMLAGSDFLKYPFGSSSAPQKRFVWYDKADGPMGTIYWGDPGTPPKKKKKKDKSIPVNTITGLFEQGQTDAFRKYQKLPKDRMAKCFSIVGKQRTLDLEGKTKEIVDAFMTGIHRILSGSGFGVKEVSTKDADELLSAPVVQNTFVIKAKLRNLPALPWHSPDDLNETIIYMEEKLPNAAKYKPIEQTDWVKANSNPNFEKVLNLPFTIPPTNHPIKFQVYDHQVNEKHIMGTSVVRMDFFYRYAGQEMMVKLRNAHDPKIDQLLCDANAYMLLTADAKNPIPGFNVSNGTRSNFNNVVDEFKTRSDGVGDVKPSKLRPFFTRSTLAFMTAGCSITLWSSKDDTNESAMLYFRSVEPYGAIVLTTEKSGDIDGMDKQGNPRDPHCTVPMEWITECRLGVSAGQFQADKQKKARPDCCMTLMYKVSGAEDGLLASLDIETRDPGTRDAWSTGIQEYISSVLEGNEGEDDDDLFSFIKGGAKRGGGGFSSTKGGAVGPDGKPVKKLGEGMKEEEVAAEAAEIEQQLTKSFAKDDMKKLGKSLLDDDDDDVSGIDLFGKDPVKKKKNVLNPDDVAVSGDGAPPAPPMTVMLPDMVMGDGAPPPPPGPPGAPGAPGMGIPKYNGPKLKHFHWEVLAPSDGAEGTLWNLIKDDLDKEGSALLEELFKAADLKALKKKDDAEDEKKGVRLLDSKRANNIEIVLKSFRMPNNAIRDAILQVDTTILTIDKIQALLSMVPSAEEKKLLKAYVKAGKDVEKLGIAEQFALYMLEISRVDTRLRLLLFQSKYDSIVDEMTQQYIRLIAAGEKVKESTQLQKVMETILSVGNKLNQGTRTGGASGFRLASLDKLNDTKSTDNKQTLLDFIVEYVMKHKMSADDHAVLDEPDQKLVEAGSGLPSYLDTITGVKDAALIDWSALNAEREMLMHGLQELTKEVEEAQKEEPVDGDRFPQVMQAFLEHALHKAKKMKKKYLDAQELIDGLFEYFGENESSFEPTEFFKLFDRFLNAYKASELKIFQKRLKARRESVRKENEAAKIKKSGGDPNAVSSSSSADSSSSAPAVDLQAVLRSRRASMEGIPKEASDEWDDAKPARPVSVKNSNTSTEHGEDAKVVEANDSKPDEKAEQSAQKEDATPAAGAQ